MADVISQPTITRATAQRALSAAVAEADRLGTVVSVAVTCSGGHPRAFYRMDGAPT